MQESIDELGSENIWGGFWILNSNIEGLRESLCPGSGPSIVFVLSSDSWELQEQPLEQGWEAKNMPFLAPPSLDNKSPFYLFFPSLFITHFFMSSKPASARRMGNVSWTVPQPWRGAPVVDAVSLRARTRVPTTALPCAWLLPIRCFKINAVKG